MRDARPRWPSAAVIVAVDAAGAGIVAPTVGPDASTPAGGTWGRRAGVALGKGRGSAGRADARCTPRPARRMCRGGDVAGPWHERAVSPPQGRDLPGRADRLFTAADAATLGLVRG